MNSPSQSESILVGVDGSPSSVSALREAAGLARVMRTEMFVVTCWRVPDMYTGVVDLDSSDFRDDADKRQTAALTEAFGGDCPVPMQRLLRHGRAAPELIEASQSARMLVVGNRGHGEFVNLILGSVSLECIAHAHCPVVTVRHQPATSFEACAIMGE